MQVTCDRCGETYEIQFRTRGLLLCDECAGATLEQQYRDILEANKDDQAVEADWREVRDSLRGDIVMLAKRVVALEDTVHMKDINELLERVATLEDATQQREGEATIIGEDEISKVLKANSFPISAKNPYKFLLGMNVHVEWVYRKTEDKDVPIVKWGDMALAMKAYRDNNHKIPGARNA